MKLNGKPIQILATIVAGERIARVSQPGERTEPNQLGKSVDRADFVEEPFENVGGCQDWRDPRNKQGRQTKVLSTESLA